MATVDNPLWPLKPGTAYHYQGARGTTPQTDDEVVTHRTKRILGIDAIVVRDTVSKHGHAIERTLDFYAQDTQGNVWYLGEDSYERQNGRLVTASDSWRSGVDGAEPGIIMPAHPRPGDRYRQEYYPPGGRSTRRTCSAGAGRWRCRIEGSRRLWSRASSCASRAEETHRTTRTYGPGDSAAKISLDERPDLARESCSGCGRAVRRRMASDLRGD